MKFTAAIRQLEIAIMIAKSNRSNYSELENGLKVLKAAESLETGSARKATDGGTDGPNKPIEKPTLTIRWEGSI